jgi:hypothetical protein
MEHNRIIWKGRNKKLKTKTKEIHLKVGSLSSIILKQEQEPTDNLFTGQLMLQAEIPLKLFAVKEVEIYALGRSRESKTELKIFL